jgi:hypothetical protein
MIGPGGSATRSALSGIARNSTADADPGLAVMRHFRYNWYTTNSSCMSMVSALLDRCRAAKQPGTNTVQPSSNLPVAAVGLQGTSG